MASTASSIRTRVHHAHLLDPSHPRARCIGVYEPNPNESRAARGNLYILIELMGESPVKDQAVREIQSIAELTYYSAGGSVSAVLEQAILNAHETLGELNRRSPDTDLRAGITCAAVVQRHLVIASAGPSLTLLATGPRLDQFPPDPGHYAGPIGGDAPPILHAFRHQLRSGDVLFLGESDWILLSNVKTIGGAIANTSTGNLREVVDYLHRQSDNADVLGLLLIYTEQQVYTPLPEGPASPRLPTAVGTAPPVRNVPGPGQPQTPHTAAQTPEATPPPGTQIAPAGEVLPPQMDVPFRPVYTQRTPWHQRLGSWWQRLRLWLAGLLLGILPDRDAPPPAQADWVGSTGIPASPPPAGDTATAPAPTRPPYTPPERTRGRRARLVLLLAILIPLLTSAVVGAAFLREGASSQEEGLKLVQLAESQLLKAQQALSVNDKATARAALGESRRYLDEAISLIGVTDEIRNISRVVAAELQDLMQIRSLYSLDVPLVEFPPHAEPHRVVVFDQDIYMLDTGRQVIEHYRTNPERTLLEENSGTILQEGDVIGGVTVGRLVDIAWQPRIAGFADKASLLVLDRNNNIFRYNRLDGATHLRIAAQGALGSVVQVETYSGRLYLADERADQIFRYAPAGLGYDEPPDQWFAGQVQAALSGLVAMNIDSDIWLLSEDGTLLRYRQGQQLPFSLENSPGLGGRLVDFALDNQPNGALFLADATQDRILVFDKEGRYIEQYVDAESLALAGLRGLFLDDVTGTLYILTRTGLYAPPLPR